MCHPANRRAALASAVDARLASGFQAPAGRAPRDPRLSGMGERMVEDLQRILARDSELEPLSGARVGHGDDQATRSPAPEQRDVEVGVRTPIEFLVDIR